MTPSLPFWGSGLTGTWSALARPRPRSRALFRQVPELPWFQENGVPYEEETLIQREIYLDGKNVCRVNGQLLSVSILRKLGLQLINIHGQRDSQQLFDEGYHLAYLDAFAGDEALLTDYEEKFQAVAALRREIQRLTMDEGEKLRRMESLKFQIEEISRAQLKPGEDEPWRPGGSSCRTRRSSQTAWTRL